MVKKKRSLGPGIESEAWKDSLLPNFNYPLDQIQKSSWRVTSFSILCLMLFFILFLRLFHLQIIKGQKNRELADSNRIQIKIIHAPRGVIYDRNGKVLAGNSPAFRLFDKDKKKARLISRDEALELEVKNDPQALDLEVDNVRSYPFQEKFAHVLGYVGEISPDQLKEAEYKQSLRDKSLKQSFSTNKNYHLGDRVGKSGIEAQYEKVLRGVDGGEIIEVNSQGEKISTLRTNPPILGQNIYLNLDAPLQDKLFTLTLETIQKLGSCCAAALAMDPQNGQVLALISLPSFDPNIFTKNEDEGAILTILTQANSPILNRSLGGTYPPGSTFKIVSSLAGLSSGKITSDTIFVDNGVMYLGTFKFTNWYFNEYGRTEGPVNLLKAIQRSNDIYFYNVGQTVGEKYLADWAKKLLLGNKLGIDLPGEVNGLIPDNDWKVKTYGQVWYPGDTLHLAIGQGFVLTTPLQILGITSYIGANGTLYQPQLINKITSQEAVIKEFKPKILISNLISADKINLVKEGLKLVPKYGGTAWPFFTFPIPTAGKTGTAEYGDPKGKTHGWYTSFAPADDPKIALTVLVEGGGEGSNVSAPIAKEVYRWYFSPDKNKLIQDVYNQATDSARTLGE